MLEKPIDEYSIATMPIYVYEEILPDGAIGERFEWEASMNEDRLLTHPISGNPVRKVLTAPNIVKKHTPGSTRSKLDNKNLEAKGFTKYERDKLTGQYHRVAGKDGPSVIQKPV
ncbi:MAG: FmdB family transcriptional regulator [Verrucomicrobia bacterium]|nr:FmdB family transcriptional regulator [Verrucomicrobiota bacterium]